MLASMTCQDEVYAAMQDERGPDTINQSINQSIYILCLEDSSEESTHNAYENSENAEFE